MTSLAALSESVQVPLTWLATAALGMSAVIVAQWRWAMSLLRHNRELQGSLLREINERVRILQGLKDKADKRGAP
jgi:hypothetical protein